MSPGSCPPAPSHPERRSQKTFFPASVLTIPASAASANAVIAGPPSFRSYFYPFHSAKSHSPAADIRASPPFYEKHVHPARAPNADIFARKQPPCRAFHPAPPFSASAKIPASSSFRYYIPGVFRNQQKFTNQFLLIIFKKHSCIF